MHRILWTFVITLAMSCLANAQAPGEKPPAASQSRPTSNAEQILKDRFREYTDALTRHDLAALDRIWSDDYTFTNPRGEFLTKKQRMANIKSGATQFESIERDNEAVRIYGNAAVNTGQVTLKAKYGGQEGGGVYRFMNVWVYRDGRWQLVANQITRIAKK